MRIHDARFETADRDAVRAYQLETLKALLAKTWATNDFYRAHWTKAGVDIEAIDSLAAFSARVPTVAKQDFVADQADDPPFGRRHAHLLSLGVPYTVFITGGTTGQGVEVHLQSDADMRGTEEIYRYQFTWAGIAPGAHTFLMLPVTMMGGGRIEYAGAVAFGLSVSAVGNYDAGRKLELLKRFRPTARPANWCSPTSTASMRRSCAAGWATAPSTAKHAIAIAGVPSPVSRSPRSAGPTT